MTPENLPSRQTDINIKNINIKKRCYMVDNMIYVYIKVFL